MSNNYSYPQTRKGDIVDDFHGTKVADPYRWLEKTEGEEISKWIDDQNLLVDDYIDQNVVKKYKDRLTVLMNYTRFTIPAVRNGNFYYTKNEGLQPQNILYMKKGFDGEEQEVFDPNKLSDDGTTAVVETFYSHDASYLALVISKHGSDWMEIWILDMKTMELFPEKIKNVRNGSGLHWKKDNSGFFYSAFVGREETLGSAKLWWHTLNTNFEKDELVFEHPEDEDLRSFAKISYDEKYQFITMSKSTMPMNLLYFRKLAEPDKILKIVDEMKHQFIVLGTDGDKLIVRTNYEADNGKIIGIDLNNYSKEYWWDIVPESELPIESMHAGGSIIVNNHIFLMYLKDAKHQVKIFKLDGKYIRDMSLPNIGSVYLEGSQNQKDVFIMYTNFFQPMTIYNYDIERDVLKEFSETNLNIDYNKFESKQVFYQSKDGTRIPMFIMHKKGLELNGNNPTLLNGYGGFNISQTPRYNTRAITWMEQDGVYAIANLRGGGEYGEKWHQDGLLENKQNVFDDFIAAAEWLIDNKYTTTPKLSILGGSNGGLLTAACVLQRPDLYGASIVAVGVLDMLRYHKYTIGRYWVPEYGDPSNPDHFKFLMKYSPVHNVKEVEYPPIFIHTADTDDRVDPAHSKKFAASLQEKGKGGPLLFRIVKKAGHGLGKPTKKLIEDMSHEFAFLENALHM